MDIIKPTELEELIYDASKASFSHLIENIRDERFYAFGLWTDDSLQFLNPAANSEERLKATVKNYNETVDPEYGTISTCQNMRWSYGDWGYFPLEENEDYFKKVNHELRKIFDLDIPLDEFSKIIDPLWDSIVLGFGHLNKEGFFEKRLNRNDFTLLIIGDLDEEFTDGCAKILNPLLIAENYINWDSGDSQEEI